MLIAAGHDREVRSGFCPCDRAARKTEFVAGSQMANDEHAVESFDARLAPGVVGDEAASVSQFVRTCNQVAVSLSSARSSRKL
jgi:hypothetical protein